MCEIQLVHAELYSVRKNMGAHGSYNEFRAALELCEKVGVDPEEEGSSDAGSLDALAWTSPSPSQQQKTHALSAMPTASGYPHHPESNHGQLLAVILAQNERHQAQNEILQAQIETQSKTITALELQISLLCTQHERFEHEMSHMKRVCEQLEQSSAVSF